MKFADLAARELNTLIGVYRGTDAVRRVQEANDHRPLRITLSSVFDEPFTAVHYGNEFLCDGDFVAAMKAAGELLAAKGFAKADLSSNACTPRSIDDFVAYRKDLFAYVKDHPELCEPWGTFDSHAYEGMIDIVATHDDLQLEVSAHALAPDGLFYHGFTLDAVTSTARFEFERARVHKPTTKDPILPGFAVAAAR
jgi:hypothetical protein